MKISDIEELHSSIIKPSVRRFLFEDRALSRDRALLMLAQSEALHAASGTGFWGVRIQDTYAFAGFVCLWPFLESLNYELSFALDARYQGQGYAREAGARMIEYVRDQLGWRSLRASVPFGNSRSIRTLSHLQFNEIALRSGSVEPMRVFERRFRVVAAQKDILCFIGSMMHGRHSAVSIVDACRIGAEKHSTRTMT